MKYGPDNPHPLSTRKTELVWEGKYDEYGNRREVDIAGCAMPMQKIETIDEPASRLKPLGLFDSEKAHKDDFRNMLIWGDNKLVMASLLKDFKQGKEGQVLENKSREKLETNGDISDSISGKTQADYLTLFPISLDFFIPISYS